MSLIKMIRESCEHKKDRKPVIFYYFYTWNDLVFHILVVNAKGVLTRSGKDRFWPPFSGSANERF